MKSKKVKQTAWTTLALAIPCLLITINNTTKAQATLNQNTNTTTKLPQTLQQCPKNTTITPEIAYDQTTQQYAITAWTITNTTTQCTNLILAITINNDTTTTTHTQLNPHENPQTTPLTKPYPISNITTITNTLMTTNVDTAPQQ